MAKVRVRYFDIARGLAILAVILGHSTLNVKRPESMDHVSFLFYSCCFSFHMPLFFALSGFFSHPESKFAWRKEIRELLVSYGLTSFMVIICNVLLALPLHRSILNSLVIWTKASIYGAGAPVDGLFWSVHHSIGAIWFLLALFWAHLLVNLAVHLPYTFIWIALFFAIGYTSAHIGWLPWSIQAGMAAATFVYLGHLAHQLNLQKILIQYPWLWIIPSIAWVASIWKFSGFSMALNQYGRLPLLTFLGSLGGTVCVVGLSKLIDSSLPLINSALVKLGRYTLAILCVHLLEDDVLPWEIIIPRVLNQFTSLAATLIIFTVRLIFDLLMALCLHQIPVINRVFFPELAKRQA